MSSDCPYLGSKISLISKAKIRYEGILYTIDTENATVALSKVRSFGTEKREVDRFVAPRDEVYEYIIFRGTDIEDLTVCEPPNSQAQPPPPQDPAIVQSVVTSQQSGPAAPTLQHFSASGPYPQVPVYSHYMPPNIPMQRPSAVVPQQSQQTIDNSGIASTAIPNLPNTTANKSLATGSSTPTSDQLASKVNNTASKEHYSKRVVESGSYHNNNRQQQQHQTKTQQQSGSGSNTTRNSNNYEKQQSRSYGYAAAANGSRNQSDNSSSTASTRTFRGNQRYGDYRQKRDDDQNVDNDQQRSSSSNQRGPGQRRYYRTQDPNGYNPNFRGAQRGPRGGRRYAGPRGREQLTFEGDFDFEESNAQFNKEDIAKELKNKLKISSSSSTRTEKPKSVPEKSQNQNVQQQEKVVDGAGDNIESSGSSGANGAGVDSETTEKEVVNGKEKTDSKEEDDVCFYDKTKSFFDNITCETTHPRGERMTWTEERRKNTETFGSAWNPGRSRGGYRGRNYRGRRGGYSVNYRGRGGYGGNMNSYRGGGNSYRGYYNSNYRGNRRDHYHDRGDYQNNNRGGGYNNYHHNNHHQNHNNQHQQYRRHPRKDGDAPTKYKTANRENNNTATTTTGSA